MNTKHLIVTMVFAFLTFTVSAQKYLADASAITKHSESVMKLMEQEKFPEMFSQLGEYWPLDANELASLEGQTIKQFNMVSGRFGKIIGKELVSDENVKDIAIRRIYVLRFEKHLIRVLFTYYHNDKGWVLNGYKWDDQIGELFQK